MFYVWWSSDRYEPLSFDEVATEEQVVAIHQKWLQSANEKDRGSFVVIEGVKRQMVPVEKVVRYELQ